MTAVDCHIDLVEGQLSPAMSPFRRRVMFDKVPRCVHQYPCLPCRSPTDNLQSFLLDQRAPDGDIGKCRCRSFPLATTVDFHSHIDPLPRLSGITRALESWRGPLTTEDLFV